MSVDDIVAGTAGCIVALARQDAKLIASQRYAALGVPKIVAVCFGDGDERTERTVGCFGRGLPIEAIARAWRTPDAARVFMPPVAGWVGRCLVALCLHIDAADVECAQFIAADTWVKVLNVKVAPARSSI